MTQYMDAAGLHSAGGVGSRFGMGAGVFPDERVPRGVWPLVGRDAETDRVKEVLLDPNVSGVLIVGAAGQGKTAVARHAVNTLPGEAEVLYIRGSSIGAGVPYSALTVLLVDLDERVARHPLVLLTALQALFGRMPGGRPIVVVDNVEDLDPQSAAVLAHLASVESVRLVVITEQLQRTPEPFVELWRNQALERIDVEPLTLEQTRDLVEKVLGAAVSRALVVALWTDSGGKAGNLRAMIPLARDSGQAEYREGIWTQRWLPPEGDVADSRIGANSLDATSGEARKTIALLCILGTLPLPMLLRYVPQVEVDGLQQDGLVRVLWSDGPTVSIDDPVAGAAFRAALARVPEPAVTEALDEIERHEDLPPASDIVLTAWLMQAGAPITGTRLLRSARYANQLAIPHLVRPFLAHLSGWQEHPDAVIEYARLALDHSEADVARSAIDTLLQAPDLQPAVRAALRLAGVRVRMRQPPAEEWLPTALVDCEADCSAVPGADGEHLRAELILLRLELSLLDGRYLEVADSSSSLLTSTLDYSSTAIRTKGMLMLALAATGQHERAGVLGEVLARSPHTASSPRDRAEAHRSSVLSLALAGQLDEALERLHDVSSSHRDVQDEAWAESMAGLLLAGSGRSRDALPLLLPAMAQLRMDDRFGLLPATEAAAAYAYALDGQDEAARAYLDLVAQPERYRGWVSRHTTDYFTVLTASLLDESGGAQVMLRAADRELARGNKGIELVLLTQAVRLGEHSAAHRLSVRSSELGSPLARSSLLLSKGILAQDPALLLEAAEAALTIGHHDLAGSSALLAVELRARDDDPLIFVRAEQILRQTSVERRRSLTRQALTERERAVARMVARGASNKDIAAAEHWSIRTAEGYVHRAMSKLGVHNRKQLRSVFAKR
ncbi:DNA-binding CsgD family transcriptional regulator/Cdc6-like AAA superfamily ATPase [Arthrobacter sp. PL16]|uniref:helix-turn-helix transcriptional regulator n=1 Tax=Arthrobacter sp. PL16 TaxID=3071720 RepID=UPI002DF935DE|nr:DNA-binding CsgD family transcriptional regulator/Cdc6-like AAA superfamily ATPase [Arthrobacter sp. PL16]